MKQIFTKILGIDVSYTTKVEDFIKHNGPKITYTKQPLQNEFFVRSNDLLFEQGINAFDIVISDWEGTPCFFGAGERSSLPFDIFSASFYLLSRYEEYLPHIKDIHDRFPAKDSIAFKYDFIELPVVDLWAQKLLVALKKRFPEIVSRDKTYNYLSVIDVTSSHSFALRGVFRSLAGLLLDLGSLKLRRVAQRITVWFNPKKDPYDNFDALIENHKKHKIKSMFFFQFASYSTYDKNIAVTNNKFQFLIKSIADYSKVSLCASYSSFNDLALLKEEKKALANVVNRPINYSRTRYNRLDVPDTYRDLIDAEFRDDYTMGYAYQLGFRAGTCTPFYFYDINLELQQPIRIHPFAVHNNALLQFTKKDQILKKMDAIYHAVKKVNGDFITVFSNELLGVDTPVKWKDLYMEIVKKYNA